MVRPGGSGRGVLARTTVAPLMEDPLRIGHGAAVPLSEIELRVSRSSGPGGQHANVTASRVEAVFDVEASRSLGDEQKRRVMARCGPVVRATAQDTRSQARNRELALERLRSRLAAALTVQRPRRTTKPTRTSRRRRLDSKRRRGELKRSRQRPGPDG
jgi:ribosome-associated protein